MRHKNMKHKLTLAFFIIALPLTASSETVISIVEKPLDLQFFPFPQPREVISVSRVTLGVIASETDRVRNLQLSTGSSWANNSRGLQLSAVLNRTGILNGWQIGSFNFASATEGVQISGVMNRAEALKGWQISSFNFASATEGVQIAGVVNRAKSLKGWQIGSFNFASATEGVQMAGVINRAEALKGWQIGSFNFASATEGVQMAGIVNKAEALKGWQIGSFNFASETEGVQIAGVLNRTKELTGTQIGIINVAESGVGRQIGFFNYHRNSWINLRAEVDSRNSTLLTFQKGLGGYYTSSSLGYHFRENQISAALAMGYRYEGDLLFLEGEVRLTKEHLFSSDVDLLLGPGFRGGVTTKQGVSFFCGGAVMGSLNDSSDRSEILPGLFILPEISLGIGKSIK